MRWITSTITVICIGIVAAAGAASASAEPVWVSKEHTLKSGETRAAAVKFTKLKIKWEDKTTTTKFEIECKKASGEAELKGGFPGTDKLTKLTFEECSLLKGGTACKLTSGSVAAEELPGWPTELKRSPISDVATGIRFSLALAGCEKGSYSKTWIFKGNLKAAIKNEAATVKLTLPTLAGGAEPLETEGDEAALSGSGELEEKAGGTLAAEEAKARWFNEANERFGAGVREDTVIENVGNMVLTSKLESVEVEIVCPVLEGEGWIENPAGGGNNGKDFELVIYKKCTVPKPGGGCKISKESFRNTAEESVLAYKGTVIVDELTNDLTGILAKITIEGCEKAGLNKAWDLEGTLVGEPNNEKSTVKFTSSSGSSLKMGGEKATLTGEDKIELEAGGKILVG